MHEKINELKRLNPEIKNCKKSRLWKTRTHAVPARVTPSKLMIIAQAPGYTEDREGRMFVGPSGKVLDRLFKKASISREEIFMTNSSSVFSLTTENRAPMNRNMCTLSRSGAEPHKPTIIATLGILPRQIHFQEIRN